MTTGPGWAGRMPIDADDRVLLHRLTRPEAPQPPGLDDDTLVELLRRAQAGEPLAGEQVLGALAMRLAGMARRSHQTTFAHFVSAAWLVIASFNLARGQKVLTNLTMDTLKQVTRERVSRWDDEALLRRDVQQLPDRGAPPRAEDEAARMLAAARHLRLLDERTSGAIEAVYVEGYSGREAADRLGSSHDLVRQRCSRGIKRLRQHREALSEFTAG